MDSEHNGYFCPVERFGVTPHCLYRDSLTLMKLSYQLKLIEMNLIEILSIEAYGNIERNDNHNKYIQIQMYLVIHT